MICKMNESDRTKILIFRKLYLLVFVYSSWTSKTPRKSGYSGLSTRSTRKSVARMFWKSGIIDFRTRWFRKSYLFSAKNFLTSLNWQRIARFKKWSYTPTCPREVHKDYDPNSPKIRNLGLSNPLILNITVILVKSSRKWGIRVLLVDKQELLIIRILWLVHEDYTKLDGSNFLKMRNYGLSNPLIPKIIFVFREKHTSF